MSADDPVILKVDGEVNQARQFTFSELSGFDDESQLIDVSKIDSTAFTNTPEMAEIGYRTTVESLPRIREVLHNLDGDLFSK